MNTEDKIKQAFETFLSKKNEYGKVDVVILQMLNSLFPQGIPYDRIEEAMYFVRVTEKLARIASENISQKAKEDAYRDVAGYALLGVNKFNLNKK